MLDLAFEKGIFFSLWLPMNKNDFFESIGFHQNPLDEGSAIKVIKYFYSNPDFSLLKDGNLYLPREHTFFYKNKKDYYTINAGLNEHLLKYVHDEINDNCELCIQDNKIKNTKHPEDKSINIKSFIGSSDKKVQIKIPYLQLYLLHEPTKVELTLTVDAYGFYFFDFSENPIIINGNELADIIANMFGGNHICHSLNKKHNYANHNIAKALNDQGNLNHYKGILTHDQLLFLQEGVANYNLNYKLFFEIIDPSKASDQAEFDSIIAGYKVGRLIKRILVPYQKNGLKKKISESIKSAEFYEINLEDSVAVRIYNFNYVTSLVRHHDELVTDLDNVITDQEKAINTRVEKYSFEHNDRITNAGFARNPISV